MYVNKIFLAGNLGQDADIRKMPNGTSVANWSMATTRRYTTQDGEKREETNWFRCKLYGKTVDAIGQYLVKGKQVYVEGHVQIGSYEKEQDGIVVTQKSIDVIVDNIQLLGSKDDSESDSAPAAPLKQQVKAKAKVAPKPKASAMFEDDDDEIPF